MYTDSHIHVRRAALTDLPAIAQLEASSFGGLGYTYPVLRQLYDLFCLGFLVAESGGNVVGSIVFGLADATDDVRILSLAVDSAHRRQGVGGALLSAGLNAHAGHAGVRLTVAPDNKGAIALCEEFEFSEFRFSDSYFGPEQPRITMRADMKAALARTCPLRRPLVEPSPA